HRPRQLPPLLPLNGIFVLTVTSLKVKILSNLTASEFIAQHPGISGQMAQASTHRMRTFRIDRMATYTFKVLDGCGDVEDETGVSFRHRDRAIRYARNVVHELMRNREIQTRSWRLNVYENGEGPICTIPFASIDPTLDHVVPTLRTMVEAMSERKRLLSDVLHAVKVTVQESRALGCRLAESHILRVDSVDRPSATDLSGQFTLAVKACLQ